MDVSSVTCNQEKRATRKSINLSSGRQINHSTSSSSLLVQMLLFTTLLSTITLCCVPIVDAFHSKSSLDSPDSVESTSKTSNIYAPSNVHPVAKTKASKHKVKHHRDHSQVKGAKRSTDYWPKQDKIDTRALQSVFNSFKVSPNTIIR